MNRLQQTFLSKIKSFFKWSVVVKQHQVAPHKVCKF